MSLSIHLGAHKTASTYLERSIWTVEEQLMKQGYMFLTPNMLRDKPFQLNRAVANRARDRKLIEELRKLLRGILAENQYVLISEEQILGALGSVQFLGEDGRIYLDADKRVLNLLHLFGTTDATLYLSVRSPTSFLTSAFGEHFVSGYKPADGHLLTPEVFFSGYHPASLRWLELVARLLKTGVARVVCWRFEDLPQIKGRVLGHMLNEDLASQIKELPLVRPGMTQTAYDKIADLSAGLTLKERDQLIKRSMKEHPKGPNEPGLKIFDDAVTEQCNAIYKQDCKRIAALPGVEFIWPDGVA